MNRNQVLSLRMPSALKRRLEHQAKNQGISLNQMATYLINTELTQLETIELYNAIFIIIKTKKGW
jgi:predicted DNA-binding protein